MFDIEDSDGSGRWVKRTSAATLEEAIQEVEFLRTMHSRAFRITYKGNVVREWAQADTVLT